MHSREDPTAQVIFSTNTVKIPIDILANRILTNTQAYWDVSEQKRLSQEIRNHSQTYQTLKN